MVLWRFGTYEKGQKASKMFKVVWDREHNGVRLTQSPQGEGLNVAPRPVFYEELDFLKMADQGWEYPHCHEPLLWACERRYFYRGELVLEVHGGNIFEAPTVAAKVSPLRLLPVDMDRLREENEDALFILEHEAMNFIAETYERYRSMGATSAKNPEVDFQQLAEGLTKKRREAHVVVREDCDSFDIMPLSEAERQGKRPVLSGRVDMFIASFSGGKDSMVVLDLVSRVVPPEDFLVIYSDTGYELPTSLALYKEIEEYYTERCPGLKFHTARNHQPVLYYWDQMGSPSNTHRWCCGVMKTAPLYLKIKELSGLGKQPRVVSFIGTRAEESARRAGYSKVAKDAKHAGVINVSPILEWNTCEIWLYILLTDIMFNKAYRMGYNRVGCILCPFGSDWTDHLGNHLFEGTAKPFTNKLSEMAHKRGVKDIKRYIGDGNWKLRAGGMGKESSSVTYISVTPDFEALAEKMKESVEEWLKVLGSEGTNTHKHTIRNRSDMAYVEIVHSGKKTHIKAANIGEGISLPSLLKKVVNKATYCVHCGMCEVECPVGALKVYPRVAIDAQKCIQCHRCLDFYDNGCITASSIKQTEGIKMNTAKQAKTTINRYNTFGYREHWLQDFMENSDTYFNGYNHGLTVPNQFTPFINYLRDSRILENGSRTISETGRELIGKYSKSKQSVWEVIWVNLFECSEIFYWFANNVQLERLYPKEEVEILLAETLPQYSPSVRKNALASLQDTLNSSPIGTAMHIGEVHKEKNKPFYYRKAFNDLSLVGVAYSLYRYAERAGRWGLTVSEFYHEGQREGVYRQFGVEREALERKLRSLQEEKNRVLSVELNMGLDNILLRQDINSLDILKMML